MYVNFTKIALEINYEKNRIFRTIRAIFRTRTNWDYSATSIILAVI